MSKLNIFLVVLLLLVILIKFKTTQFIFQSDVLPINLNVDINIGTNLSPMEKTVGRDLILIDPLFEVCDKISRINGIYFLCIAVSNYSGFASFKEYNTDGLSSSLATVKKGTSHERGYLARDSSPFLKIFRHVFRHLRNGKICRIMQNSVR